MTCISQPKLPTCKSPFKLSAQVTKSITFPEYFPFDKWAQNVVSGVYLKLDAIAWIYNQYCRPIVTHLKSRFKMEKNPNIQDR